MKVRTSCLSLIHQHRCLVVTVSQQRPDLCFQIYMHNRKTRKPALLNESLLLDSCLCKILSKQWNLEQLDHLFQWLYTCFHLKCIYIRVDSQDLLLKSCSIFVLERDSCTKAIEEPLS